MKNKPISMEGDTFKGVKDDMTVMLNKLLRLMQRYGAEKGALTVKLDVDLEETDDGPMPSFKHTVTTTVQRKDKKDGRMNGYYLNDNGGELELVPVQLEMFEA